MTAHVLGIDGGGTRTRAIILDDTGTVLGIGTDGPSNYNDVGIEQAQIHIGAAMTKARAAAGLSDTAFDGVFMGMAGVVSHRDHAAMQTIASNLHLSQQPAVGVDHDCRIALAGSLSGRPGIVLVAGTGSSVYGRNAKGEGWRTGGWGHLIGDEGSSYWLGLQAMRLAVMAYDGRITEETQLPTAVMNHLGITDMNDIMYHIYVQDFSRSDIAALAPLVMQAACSGDPQASALIRQAIADLVVTVAATARRLGLAEEDVCKVSIVGGMLNAGDVFIKPLHEALTNALPNARITPAEMPPVMGAGLLALEEIMPTVDVCIIDRLRAQQTSALPSSRS